MIRCICGHDESRHDDRTDVIYGCSYEFDPKVERGRWMESDHGYCRCLAFDAVPEPGKPIVFGVHRIPGEAESWTTESEAERDRKFVAWVRGAPGDMA